MSWWSKSFSGNNEPTKESEFHLSRGTDRLGREVKRIDFASDKYICDTCNRRLSTDEGYLLTTKQVVLSVESWRRVLFKWKQQYSALSKEHPVKGYYLLVTKTREQSEPIAELWRSILDKLKRDCPDPSLEAFIEHGIFGRGASQTPWVICDYCTPMFTFDQQQAQEALKKYRRTGKFKRGKAVFTVNYPKTDGRILVESNDDETWSNMLKAINVALEKNLDGCGHVDGTGFQLPNSQGITKNIQKIAETWLQYYVDGIKKHPDQEKEWAVKKLYDLSLNEPTLVWEAVQHITSIDLPDDKYCEYVDVIIGGCLLANILYACDEALWKTVLDVAAENTRYRRQLFGIDKSSLSKKRWKELRRFLSQRR